MDPDIQELLRRITDLPRHQRLLLTRLLLELDRSVSTRHADGAWEEEIQARVKAAEEGRVTGISYDDIRKEMSDRLQSR